MKLMTTHIYASCVEKNGRGILLRGHAGAGKSSFTLSLINRGMSLVGDDQIRINNTDGKLIARPAENIKGLLEVRGIGILNLNYSESCEIVYVINLVPGYHSERLPENQEVEIQGVSIRTFNINPLDPTAIEKVLILFHPVFQDFYQKPALSTRKIAKENRAVI